jgi:hypothetical protein
VALARSHRTTPAPYRSGISAAPSDRRRDALLETLREILAEEGLPESRSAEQEGIFFTVESRDEVSLQYIESERSEMPAGFAPSLKARTAIFRCFSILADCGYSSTLVLSPRTLSLSVRSEGHAQP